jgi:hypothetical protein
MKSLVPQLIQCFRLRTDGGAVASVAGAVFSGYSFYNSPINKLTYSDAFNIAGATFAVAGLFFTAPVVGGIGLGIGLFQMFSGAGGYLDLDNSTLYDNRNGLQPLKIN